MFLPEGRSVEYATWRACERARILFPGMRADSWDDLDIWSQAKILAYDQIRSIEEVEFEAKKIEAAGPRL